MTRSWRLSLVIAAVQAAGCSTAAEPAMGARALSTADVAELEVKGVAAVDTAGQADAAGLGASDLDPSDLDAGDLDTNELDAALASELPDISQEDAQEDAAESSEADTDGGGADVASSDAADAVDVPDIMETTSEAAADTDSVAVDAGDQDSGKAAEVDAAPPKIGPQDPTSLPIAPFTDVTAAFAINPMKIHGACVGIGDIDGNTQDDFLVIELDTTKATIHTVLLGGAKVQHVFTPFDTSLLLPTTGCSLVDMDSDGKLDLLVGGHAGAALYMGDGKGGFVDQSAKWLPFIMDFATLTLAPVDLDGDGDLDIFVGAGVTPVTPDGGGPACGSLTCDYDDTDFICTMAMPFPESPQELQDRVLIQGAKLPMTDDTTAWKVPAGGIWSNAMPADVDADGKMDVLVGDDFGAHRLLRNLGGSFEAHSEDIGFHAYGHGMGWGIGDFNGDGLADLVMADAGPNPLYLQVKASSGKPVGFIDDGGARGVWGPTWAASSWSPLVADFDQDGRDDIMLGISIATTLAEFPKVAAGCTGTPKKPYAGHPNPDVLFLSNGSSSTFTAHQFPSGPYSHFAMVTQGVLDLDGDGDLDLVQTRPNVNMTSMVRIVRNDVPNKGKSCLVKVTGKKGNLDALGTVVSAKIDGHLRTRWLNGTGGTGGTRSRVAHFGLGTADKATDVTITWPNGAKTKVGDVGAGETKAAAWP